MENKSIILEFNGLISIDELIGHAKIGNANVSEIAKPLNGRICKLKYYISPNPIDKETAAEYYLQHFYEGNSEILFEYRCWTDFVLQHDTLQVGSHDIIEELYEKEGKYCYLILETILNNQNGE